MNFKHVDEKFSDEFVLIHYGSERYQSKKVDTVRNSLRKPQGGLWTSPIKSEWGWKDWCGMEDFRKRNLERSFKVKLKIDSKLLVIDTYKNLHDAMEIYKANGMYSIISPSLDFERISKVFSGIWLTGEGQMLTRFSRPYSLYGWDCESVLILDKNSVYQID